MRNARTGSLGRLLPVDVVEPDGLIITLDGHYVRLIECERMPNAITADDGAQTRIERGFAEICRGIPDRQALAIYAQTDPIPVAEALAEDRRRVQIACGHDRRHGREDLAQARCRLLSAQTQSVVHAAGSEQPAVAARWWLAVPHKPVGEDLRIRFRHALAPGGARTAWRSHQRAAADSLRQTEQVQATTRGGRDRAMAARWRASAGMPVGALSPRRPHATRPGRARRRDRTGGRNHGRGGRPPPPPDSRRHLLGPRARGNRRCRSSLATSPRRDAQGDSAPRNTADPHHAVVADAPAVSTAAGHRRGSHPRREPRPDTRPPATALEAPVRRDRLQAPPSAADRLKRARSTR